jgi:NTP pyrophosphatase (non-canonical NTP hydrolase)
MDLSDYQDKAKETATIPDWKYFVMGLAGEAGEVANKCKKILRDDNGIITDEKRGQIADELGDCLWYIAMVADSFGLDLNVIGHSNLEKLKDRKNRGVTKGSGDKR